MALALLKANTESLEGLEIAQYVMKQVHHLDVSEDQVNSWLDALVQDVHHHKDHVLCTSKDHSSAVYDLGVLLSASGLTLRYITHRQLLLPHLEFFSSVFDQMLHFPKHDPVYYPLQLMSLRGVTRLIESYGDELKGSNFVSCLEFILSQLETGVRSDDTSIVKLTFLFRAMEECVNVMMQVFPAQFTPERLSQIWAHVLPLYAVLHNTQDVLAYLDFLALVMARGPAFHQLSMHSSSRRYFDTQFRVHWCPKIQSFHEDLEDDGDDDEPEEDGTTVHTSSCFGPSERLELLEAFVHSSTFQLWSRHIRLRASVWALLPLVARHSVRLALLSIEKCTTRIAECLEIERCTSTQELELLQDVVECLDECCKSLPRYFAHDEPEPEWNNDESSLQVILQDHMPALFHQVLPFLKKQYSILTSTQPGSVIKPYCAAIRSALGNVFLHWVLISSRSQSSLEDLDVWITSIVPQFADPMILLYLHNLVCHSRSNNNNDSTPLWKQTQLELTLRPLVQSLTHVSRYSRSSARRILFTWAKFMMMPTNITSEVETFSLAWKATVQYVQTSAGPHLELAFELLLQLLPNVITHPMSVQPMEDLVNVLRNIATERMQIQVLASVVEHHGSQVFEHTSRATRAFLDERQDQLESYFSEPREVERGCMR